jgi:hypothetical protein
MKILGFEGREAWALAGAAATSIGILALITVLGLAIH